MKEFIHTDKDGHVYKLIPYESKAGDPACIGCDAAYYSIDGSVTGGMSKCRSFPTCTPKSLDYKMIPLVSGRHVWKKQNEIIRKQKDY